LADPPVRSALFAVALLTALPATAGADWYFTPFIGPDFKASTTIVDLEYGSRDRTKVTFGGSAALILGIFGAEVDYAYVPRFFRNPECQQLATNTTCSSVGPLITDNHVQTLTGNVIVAAPLSLTQESLRPYAVAGIGWMDVAVDDLRAVSPVDKNLTAFNVGVGAIGMLGNRAGLRFDLRYFTNLDRETAEGISFGSARLHFWRATVGVTLRY
jgi:hypothetical protein